MSTGPTHYLVGDVAYPADNSSAARYGKPVVVIDPEDREQVERLCDAYAEASDPRVNTASEHGVNAMQAVLREFANPTPPKPEEPMGRFAVVAEGDGREWVRGFDDLWHQATARGKQPHSDWITRTWDRVAAVKVLSEGVTP